MKIVILDRDGVLNFDSEHFIKSPDEWRPIPHSLEAVARLNQAGFRVVVVTNQSGVGRGLFDMATLNAIHAKMHRALGRVGARVDALFFCPHAADAGCQCRKPRPGMLLEVERRFNVSLAGVPCVGDSLRDLLACTAVGARPILVRTGKGERTALEPRLPENTLVFRDLDETARYLVTKVTP